MSGHETPEEKKIIQQLEAKIDLEKSPIEELLELATLYMEPSHREDEAASLLKTILERDPGNEITKILLAYCCIFCLLDKDSITYAEKLLKDVISTNGELKGAAYNILPSALLEFGKLSASQKIEYFGLSVKFEPNWVNNHYNLAWAFKQAGMLEKAIEEMEIALKNMIESDPEWSYVKEFFEISITGRAADDDTLLKSDLERFKRELEKRNRSRIRRLMRKIDSILKKIFRKG